MFGRYWRIPPGEIPAGKDELVDWLFTWWSRIDRWIDDCRARVGLEPLPKPVPEAAPSPEVIIDERG